MTSNEKQILAKMYYYATSIAREVTSALENDDFNPHVQKYARALNINESEISEDLVEFMINSSKETIKDLANTLK